MDTLFPGILTSFIVPIILGYAVVSFLFRHRPLGLLFNLALSYGLGMGLLTQWMLILGILKKNFSVYSIGLPLITVAVSFLVGVVFCWRDKRASRARQIQRDWKLFIQDFCVRNIPVKISWLILLGYIAYEIYFVFRNATNVPVYTWDAIYFISKKAKVFFYDQSMAKTPYFPVPFYPMHASLAQTWVALNLNVWDDQWIKIIFPVAFLSYSYIHFHILKKLTNFIWALIGVVLLFSSNLFIVHASIEYSDFFLIYYNCTAIGLLLFWSREKNNAYLLLAAMFAGLATFCKLEGLIYFVIQIILVAYISFQDKGFSLRIMLRRVFQFSVIGFSIYSIFYFYKFTAHIPAVGRLNYDFQWEHLIRLKAIAGEFAWNLFSTGNWNILWFLLAVSLIHLPARWKWIEVRLLVISLVLFFAAIGGLGLLTVNFLYLFGAQSYISLSRLILHFFPLASILVVLLNFPDVNPEQ